MKSSVRYLAVACMVALAACGDDDSVSPDDLSQAQAEALATAVFTQSFMGAFGLNYQSPPQAPDGPALAMYTWNGEATHPCPLGGEVAISAAVDVETNDETGAGTIDFDVEQVPSGCVVQADNGTQFTLNGDPSLTFDFLMENDGEQNLDFGGTLGGAVAYSFDDGEGSCPVTMEFTGSGTPNGFSFANAGTVCGMDFSTEFSFTAG